MSYKQMTGNIISATKVEPDGKFISSTASGVWSLQEQYDYVRGGNWPNAANPLPRGIFAGGSTSSAYINVMEFVVISTAGDVTDFGDLSAAKSSMGSFASSTRGIFAAGLGGGQTKCNRLHNYSFYR